MFDNDLIHNSKSARFGVCRFNRSINCRYFNGFFWDLILKKVDIFGYLFLADGRQDQVADVDLCEGSDVREVYGGGRGSLVLELRVEAHGLFAAFDWASFSCLVLDHRHMKILNLKIYLKIIIFHCIHTEIFTDRERERKR